MAPVLGRGVYSGINLISFPPLHFEIWFSFPVFLAHKQTHLGGSRGCSSPSLDIFWENTINTLQKSVCTPVQCTMHINNVYNNLIWYDVGKEINTSQVIQWREFMTNFIWQLIQGREFTTNCSFNFFFLPLFHPLNFGCSQNLPVQLHYDPTCKICINMCTKRNYSQFREGN